VQILPKSRSRKMHLLTKYFGQINLNKDEKIK